MSAMLLNKIQGLEEFASDSLYQQFLADDFDAKGVTSSAVQQAAVAEHLAKLSTGVALLDKALHHQVSHHYEDLLSQATEIETFEGVLLAVHERISALRSSAERLKSQVAQPYESIASLTRKLRRLHLVCDLLRRIVRVVRLCRRLQGLLDRKPPELVKVAALVAEVEEVEGLEGLQVLEAEREVLRKARACLQNGAGST